MVAGAAEIAGWWGALTGLTVLLISTVSPVELLVAADRKSVV